jgi:hypothetical protein
VTKALLLAALLTLPALADLKFVQSEPNLEKRSELALEHANSLVDTARIAYKNGKHADFEAAIKEIVEAVELSSASLTATGKNARRHPKHFKRAELKTRALVRRLDLLETEVGLDDRTPVHDAKIRIGHINDDLVLQIMTKKKS